MMTARGIARRDDRRIPPVSTPAMDGVVMYELHFGFHRQPFQCAELPRAFVVSEAIRGILPQLLHALRSDLGIAVLTGPPGVGKTSLLRHLQSLLSHEGRAVLCSGASLETPAEVLLTLQAASQLRAGSLAPAEPAAEPGRAVRWNVVEHLRRSSEFWGPVLLLIDDAQLLSVQVLNELRAFSEEESNGRSLVRCLISGPLSFEEDLARSTHVDFSRRIRCHAFLQPLSSRESIEFLSRHLEAVGGKLRDVFSPTSLEIIADAADGIPRCLSLLADESMVVAAEQTRKLVDDHCVRAALTRLRHLPYSWNVSPLSDDTDEAALAGNPVINDSADEGRATALNPAAATPTLVRPSIGVVKPAFSTGVIEFGSGAIEFGATPKTELAPPVVEPTEAAVDPIDIESLSKSLDFEVGRRFVIAEATTDLTGKDDQYSIADDAVDIDGPHWLGSMENGDVASDGSDGSAARITANGCSTGVPVFDRYTWIALGRDVTCETSSVTSASDLQRVNGGLSLVRDDLVLASECRPETAFDHIAVIQSTDQEIVASLTHSATAPEHGEFLFFPTPFVLSHQRGQTNHESSPVRPVAIADDDVSSLELQITFFSGNQNIEDSGFQELQSCDSETPEHSTTLIPPRLWDDGQLLFGPKPAAEPDSSRGPVAPRLANPAFGTPLSPDPTLSATETGDHLATGEIALSHESAQSPSYGKSFAVPSTEEQFYTLPVPLKSIEWDLRSAPVDFGEVRPLAESVAAFRDEVTLFQQGGRRHSEETSETAEATYESPSSESLGECSDKLTVDPKTPDDSLVARARHRLENMEQLRSYPGQRTIVAANPDSHIDADFAADSAGVNRLTPKFGLLFTRLRQKRSHAGKSR